MDDTHDLGLVLDAKTPIIVIESPDEPRVLKLLLSLALARGLPLYEWSETFGLRPGGITSDPQHEPLLVEPDELLAHLARNWQAAQSYTESANPSRHAPAGAGLYALCDLHPYINEPKIARWLKDLALDHARSSTTIILISHKLTLPAELSGFSATFNLSLPSEQELMAIVRENALQWASQNSNQRVRTDRATLDKLIANLRGLTHADAHKLIRRAIFDDGAIDESDLPDVNRLKYELLDAKGVLRFEYTSSEFSEVAGLANLKHWLELRKAPMLENREDQPKGVMLLGVQGGGKSLAAKCVASAWGLPLLRLDFGALYNKYFGETERNLRNCLNQAEQMSPCVLWMDEIEKGIATGDGDNATSQRVLGTLLTWMAENTKPVFIVATSNDISKLPPELVRKGRLDEVFFIDLPDQSMRQQIFDIHLRKRQARPDDFDLVQLADATDGFTGAEIEQAIVSARYLCETQTQPLCTASVLTAINRTYPMSVLRSEYIENLRDWAENRTVPA